MFDRTPFNFLRSLQEWWAALVPGRQLTFGCLGVMLAGIFALYCGGTLSLMIRPFFQAPQGLVPTVLIATSFPTLTPAALIPLPSRLVPSTPTQGPIPSREPATATATPDPFTTPSATMTGTFGTPRASVSPTLRSSATPTRR